MRRRGTSFLVGDEHDLVDVFSRSKLKASHVWLFAASTALLSLAVLFLVPGTGGPVAVVFVPTVLAAALIRTVSGSGQVRALLFGRRAWRITLEWVTITLGLAVLARVGVGIAGEMLPGYEWEIGTFTPLLLGVFLFAAGEEIGWRGFALPLLLARGYAPLTAVLLLGIPWSVLHLPLVLPGALNEGWSPWAMLLFMMSLTVIVSWCYLAAGSSILAAVLFHGGQNALSFLNVDIDPRAGSWVMAGVYGAIALSVVVMTGGRLGARNSLPISEANTKSKVQY
jgi:uncharacterized protein